MKKSLQVAVLLVFFQNTSVFSQCPQNVIDSINAYCQLNVKTRDGLGPCNGAADGYVQAYNGGAVYSSQTAGTHEISGAFYDAYLRNGGAEAFGLPITDVERCSDGKGQVIHLQLASIYQHPGCEPNIIYGLIQKLWNEMGSEAGILGYPGSDEFPIYGGGRCSRFQNGNIYYHPNLGIFPIYGEIFEKYSDQLWETGYLGYPVSMPYFSNGLLAQDFEGGILQFNSNWRDMRNEIVRRQITVRDRGIANTSAVHAMTFLLEYAYSFVCSQPFGGWASDLNEVYLAHGANLVSSSENGYLSLSMLAAAYDTFGVAVSDTSLYDTSFSIYDYNMEITDQKRIEKWQNAVRVGRGYKENVAHLKGHFIKNVNEPAGLSDAQIDTICRHIQYGRPVVLGRSYTTVIVGFNIYGENPGGGLFIMRDCESPQEHESGYFYETFGSVKSTAKEVFVYTLPFDDYQITSIKHSDKSRVMNSLYTPSEQVRIITLDGRTVKKISMRELSSKRSLLAIENDLGSRGIYFAVDNRGRLIKPKFKYLDSGRFK